MSSQKRPGLSGKKQLTEEIVKGYQLPVQIACKLIALPRSQYYYHSKKDDTEVTGALHCLVFKHTCYGFKKLFSYLKRDGKGWNHKKMYRVYKLMS